MYFKTVSLAFHGSRQFLCSNRMRITFLAWRDYVQSQWKDTNRCEFASTCTDVRNGAGPQHANCRKNLAIIPTDTSDFAAMGRRLVAEGELNLLKNFCLSVLSIGLVMRVININYPEIKLLQVKQGQE